jgi:hypothetical protein
MEGGGGNSFDNIFIFISISHHKTAKHIWLTKIVNFHFLAGLFFAKMCWKKNIDKE